MLCEQLYFFNFNFHRVSRIGLLVVPERRQFERQICQNEKPYCLSKLKGINVLCSFKYVL